MLSKGIVLASIWLIVHGERMPYFIDEWGYPAQTLQTTTEDGYVLTVHRIPYGKKDETFNYLHGECTKRPVVFLLHGVECTSSIFVSNYPNNSLGFLLADRGFDVWLGNSRGNIYSQQHIHHSVASEEFWKFSWYDMMKYDLDAMINMALNVTGQEQLYYIGHSQGNLIMFTKLASDHRFANKVRKFFALAPVGSIKNIRGLIEIIAKELPFSVEYIKQHIGYHEFLSDNIIMDYIKKIICQFPFTSICENIMFMLAGPSDQMDTSRIVEIFSDLPGGTSTMNIYHYMQMVRSGKVQAYDWNNISVNLDRYGMMTPPIFNYSNIDIDMHIYWGGRDWVSDKKDVETSVISQLKAERLIENVYLEEFNHIDFLWGREVTSKVYEPIIKAIASFVNN